MVRLYPNVNLESYQRQANDLVAKIGQLQQFQQQTPILPPQIPAVIPQIQYVRGMEGAREFLNKMPSNGNAVLMDRDEALFYVVSKDANGNPAPIAFASFSLETEKPPEEPAYVTKQDFEALRNELRQLLEQKGETK